MKATGTTNQSLQILIDELKKVSLDTKMPIWKRIATDLEAPSRRRRIVNLSRINRFTKDNEVIIVPGKVLGTGVLDRKITISAFQFSAKAKDKISKAGAKYITIKELMQDSIKGKKVRIIG